MIKIVIFVIMLSLYGFHAAYADQIFTTYRDDGNQTIFDGKWTFIQEWKRTSYNSAYGESLVIRTGHDYKNLYVLIDFLNQKTFSKFSDFGIVCIDGNNEKEATPQKDDYCFLVTLGSNQPKTLQGGNFLGINNHFSVIKNNPNLVAIGGISDENDRYSSTPHSTYEFKIPLEIFDKSDRYGFFVGAYVANENKIYSWPENINNENIFQIPPPILWGELVSPDKTLPEFPWPEISLLLATIFVIYLNKIKQISFNLR